MTTYNRQRKPLIAFDAGSDLLTDRQDGQDNTVAASRWSCAVESDDDSYQFNGGCILGLTMDATHTVSYIVVCKWSAYLVVCESEGCTSAEHVHDFEKCRFTTFVGLWSLRCYVLREDGVQELLIGLQI